MIIAALFIILFLAATAYSVDKGATVIISTVRGVMIGGLYNVDKYDEDEEHDRPVNYHTIQFCFCLVTFTYQWTTLPGLEK